MKLQDIQAELLKDKETVFVVTNRRDYPALVIDSIETVDEVFYTKGWQRATRKVNYVVGRLVSFETAKNEVTFYDGTVVPAKPAHFEERPYRERLAKVAYATSQNLDQWKQSHLDRDTKRIETQQSNAQLLIDFKQALVSAGVDEKELRSADAVPVNIQRIVLDLISTRAIA